MTTSERPQRKTEHLRIGRLSVPHARYFITLCAHSRKTDLSSPDIAESIRDGWRQQHRDEDYILHCATIMPDHIHWLCTLGERLSLAQIISKFKSHTKAALTGNQLLWQRNYYDHRLRAETAMEVFAKYIFLNPYRKELITTDVAWPWWTLNKNYIPEFSTLLKNEKYPQPEWLPNQRPLNELVETDLEFET